MARNRTWMLHLNLDAFNAIWMTLDGEKDQALFVLGLCKGMNNSKPPVTCSDAMVDGFELGSNMRTEAEGYRESRRTIGKLGGNPHLNHKVNHKVNQEYNHVDNAILNPQSLILNPLTTNEERVCSEPSAPSQTSPPLMEIPCVGTGQKSWPLTEAKLAEWVEAFPHQDVKAEIRKAVQWLKDNPAKGKTARGMPAFIGRWLSNAQDRPTRGGTNGTSRPSSHRSSVDAAYKQQLREREERKRLQPSPEPTPEEIEAMWGVR